MTQNKKAIREKNDTFCRHTQHDTHSVDNREVMEYIRIGTKRDKNEWAKLFCKKCVLRIVRSASLYKKR